MDDFLAVFYTEDFETSLSDYQKALSILEQLVEPDDRKIADLIPIMFSTTARQPLTRELRNFRICLCLEVGSKPQEAIAYCQKATSVCKARLHCLKNEVKSFSDLTSSACELDQDVQTCSRSESNNSIADKQAEIETLTGLSSELEKKLEDLQQLVLNPKSILSEILGIASAKAGSGKESPPGRVSSSQLATANSSGGFDSPTISTAHTNGSTGVTHLGVVGRGVKRASNASVAEASTPKKPALESSENKAVLRVLPNPSMAEVKKEAEAVMFGVIDELFEKTRMKLKDIGILIVNCSLFNLTPSLSDMVINHYKLRGNILSYNLGGMDCSAGMISIDLARDLLQVHPNSYALINTSAPFAIGCTHSRFASKKTINGIPAATDKAAEVSL